MHLSDYCGFIVIFSIYVSYFFFMLLMLVEHLVCYFIFFAVHIIAFWGLHIWWYILNSLPKNKIIPRWLSNNYNFFSLFFLLELYALYPVCVSAVFLKIIIIIIIIITITKKTNPKHKLFKKFILYSWLCFFAIQILFLWRNINHI